MDRSNILTLIAQAYTPDEYGRQIPTETTRDVYCDVSSVSLSEWSEGGRNGLNPEYRFTMFEPDYQGEEICQFKGRRYMIYRTYHAKNDTIELYAERREGKA